MTTREIVMAAIIAVLLTYIFHPSGFDGCKVNPSSDICLRDE